MTINQRLSPGIAVCHGARMPRRTTQAGGCLLAIFILAGFVYGLAIQNPMAGVLIGTAIGIALAVLIWLVDRTR